MATDLEMDMAWIGEKKLPSGGGDEMEERIVTTMNVNAIVLNIQLSYSYNVVSKPK